MTTPKKGVLEMTFRNEASEKGDCNKKQSLKGQIVKMNIWKCQFLKGTSEK